MKQAHFLPLETFIKPLAVIYGDMPDARIERYCERLAQFSKPQLAAGLEWLELNYEKRGFPSISECYKACRQSREREALTSYTPPAPTTFRDRIPAAMRSAVGRQSLREGWAYAFAKHVERTGCAEPSGEEIVKMRNGTFEAGEWGDKLTENPGLFLGAKHLLGIWQEIQRRESELQRIYANRAA